jgi:hypothetical protein
MAFTTVKLVNERVLVKGTDVFGTDGETVLDSSQWTQVNSHKEFDQATEAFDAAVREFFAPLQEAGEKLAAVNDKTPDPIGFVVLSEEVKGVRAKEAHLVKLTKDSIILRLIESGATDRLAWVADQLEVLEADDVPVPVVPTAAEVAEAGAEATGLPLDEV